MRAACVATALAAGSLAAALPARAETVAVVVVPPFSPERYADRGAVGLMPPGDGETVSRAGALAALLRGRTEKALLGGLPGGEPLIALADRPAATTIYVSLPPPGTHPNDARYPLAIVGGSYRGVLESPSTRIPGLVSIADVAPTAMALARGGRPRIGWTQGTPEDLRELDRRLSDQTAARDPSVAVLALAALLFPLAGLVAGRPSLARAGLLAAPLALAASIALSAAGISRPAWQVPLLAVTCAAAAVALAALLRQRSALALLLLTLIAAYLAALVFEPTWPALAAIGPSPGEGGRFFGSTNLTTSIVLAACLFAGAALGVRGLTVVAALSLVTVGWSRAGADGGGILVIASACLVLATRLVTGRLTARTLALACGATAALGLALVSLDAVTGGESHVTRRVGEGPGALLSELGNRVHISVERLVSSWHAALVFALAMAALVVLTLRRPRFTGAEALLTGIAVSLLVNDTPQHVAAAGAISYGAWWAYERSRLSGLRPSE